MASNNSINAPYSTGSWTPIPSNLTIVGTPTYSGTYVKIGVLVTCTMTIGSTTSTTSAQATTSFTGLPFPPANISTVATINATNGMSIDLGALFTTGSGIIYPPTWTALGSVVISFSYIATTN